MDGLRALLQVLSHRSRIYCIIARGTRLPRGAVPTTRSDYPINKRDQVFVKRSPSDSPRFVDEGSLSAEVEGQRVWLAGQQQHRLLQGASVADLEHDIWVGHSTGLGRDDRNCEIRVCDRRTDLILDVFVPM